MKTWRCHCGNKIFFENTLCQACQGELGFIAEKTTLSALEKIDETRWRSKVDQYSYRKCQNYINQTGCNWMIPDADPDVFCWSCRLSEIIPNLNKSDNIKRWHIIERAKRRLVYSLLWLQLPFTDKKTDPDKGLSFQLTEDEEYYSEFARDISQTGRVLTGHIGGVITLNIAEADTAWREQTRARMKERYRTLLGHLRHESGHYYWERLVLNSQLLDEFRLLFGDERENYAQALQNYYNHGPRQDWQSQWISAYASAHPWEDWAECWAHYLHMVDTMETAYQFANEVYVANPVLKEGQFHKQFLSSIGIDQLLDEWKRLSVFINEINRSLGLADAYPFYLSGILIEKMAFIHKVITSC